MSWSWPKVLVRTRSLLQKRPAPTVASHELAFQGTLVEPPQSGPQPSRTQLSGRLGSAPFSMEDYAELVVALCAYAYPPPDVMQRFGIHSEEELARVHNTWQERLAKDEALRRRWLQMRDEVARRWSQPAA